MPETNPYPVESATRPCCGGIGAHAADCGNAPVDLDPPAPEIARWHELADRDTVVFHAGDASMVIPFPRPKWADPDDDAVSKSLAHTRYRSAIAAVPLGLAHGEADDDLYEPAEARVRGMRFGDGVVAINLTFRKVIEGEWVEAGANMHPTELAELIEVLQSALDLVATDSEIGGAS